MAWEIRKEPVGKLRLDRALIDRSLAQDSLAAFCRSAWPIIEPRTRLDWSWHHDLIAEYLEAVERGEIHNLIINVAPRSMKSILVSIMFPVWCWTRRPTERFMLASYSGTLATKHSRDRRAIILSPWYQRNWHLRLRDDANRIDDFASAAGGHMSAVSVGGSVTGRGAMIIICDDLISPAQADSEAERETALRFFDETLSSRLDDKKNGAFVIVEQRTNAHDLTGHLLEAGGGWVHLFLPAVAESTTTIRFPRSGRIVTRNSGDLLWPSREGPAEIEAAKQRGSYAFQSQYQQNPTPREGSLFRRKDFRFFERVPARFDAIVTAWDTAFKTSSTADFSACITLGELTHPDQRTGAAPGYYILHAYHDRLEFAALKRRAVEFAAVHRPEAILIEDAASGQSLLQELRTETNLPIKPVHVDSDKFSRACAIQPTVEGGRVFLPERTPWVEEFLREVLAFPGGDHDDFVDAFVMAVNHLRHRPSTRIKVYSWLGGELLYDSEKRGRPRLGSVVLDPTTPAGQCAGCGAIIGANAHQIQTAVVQTCGLCFYASGRSRQDLIRG